MGEGSPGSDEEGCPGASEETEEAHTHLGARPSCIPCLLSCWPSPTCRLRLGIIPVTPEEETADRRTTSRSSTLCKGWNLLSHLGLSCRAACIPPLLLFLSPPCLGDLQLCGLVQAFPGRPSLRCKMRMWSRLSAKISCFQWSRIPGTFASVVNPRKLDVGAAAVSYSCFAEPLVVGCSLSTKIPVSR